MARIRSIKPELPQSESMGNVSRDARLTFILLWTLSDDEGRLRGNSRMLASLLFPYDDDVPALIDGWLKELEDEGCIQRYKIDGQSFVQICNWLIHQKIDKPSKSKIPAFGESSKPFANVREESLEEGIKGSEDQGGDQERKSPPPAAKSKKNKTPLPADFAVSDRVRAWAAEKGVVNLQAHFENFVGACRAKGYAYVDWDEGFMGAIRNNWAKVGTSPVRAVVSDINEVNARNNAEAKRLLGIDNDNLRTING